MQQVRDVKEHSKRGDTIVEVLAAITIFSVVAMATMAMMNSGMKHAQVSLETTMARNEIDAQAEALRFIHNSYAADRDFKVSDQAYSKLWKKLEGDTNIKPMEFNQKSCKEAINEVRNKKNTFIVNTRTLHKKVVDETSIIETENKIITLHNSDSKLFGEAVTYPRIIYAQDQTKNENNTDQKILENTSSADENDMPKPYENIARVEGIWVQAVPQNMENTGLKEPDFFDFHIRACWHSSGSATPNTIGTILRLYNPRYAEKGKQND